MRIDAPEARLVFSVTLLFWIWRTLCSSPKGRTCFMRFSTTVFSKLYFRKLFYFYFLIPINNYLKISPKYFRKLNFPFSKNYSKLRVMRTIAWSERSFWSNWTKPMHFSPRNPNFRVIGIIFSVPLNLNYAGFTVSYTWFEQILLET